KRSLKPSPIVPNPHQQQNPPTELQPTAMSGQQEPFGSFPHPPAPTNSRKRRSANLNQAQASNRDKAANTAMASNAQPGEAQDPDVDQSANEPKAKKSRTNTPWTPAEEQRLKVMRDAGNSWSEIAKTFPLRTEGSVKKHWYKDMHYAEFAEDESAALLAAIKEYDSNKWKVIGAKVGKPAKACEQFAKENFGGKS
ncbi:hypothetical protein K504DRAFT_381974, partial [Pleomassaria siparia CBS 279.74]